MKRWYVVHTHVRSEAKAAFHLLRQGFSVYLPQYLKTRSHARKMDLIKAPLFSRYLFISIDLSKDRWYSVNSTIGVKHLICNGDFPAPLSDEIVDDIKFNEDPRGNVLLSKVNPFKKGDLVRIIDGAFSQSIGIFDGSTDEERVRVLLEFLGRQVALSVPLRAISERV